MRRQLWIGGVAAMMVCLGAMDARAQTASLSGYIKDQTGAVLRNVSVLLTSETTGFKRQVQTNDDGLYALVELPPGRYALLVEQPGFQRVLRPNLALDAASMRRVDIVLSLGAVADTVRVSAPARDLSHDTTGMGTLIRPEEVEHLPISGRTVQKLIAMAPGVIATSGMADAGDFSVHGQRSSANYVTVDGVSANVSTEAVPLAGFTAWGNGTLPGYSSSGSSSNLFALDAVEEVRIQTSSYAPEYGRTPGAQISVVTKAGTSTLRGSAYEYFRNDALDATDPFVKARGLGKPAMNFNVFGATLGGPFPFGRPVFFFGNFEGQRLRLPRFRSTGVPTQAVRDRTSGALRQLLDAYPMPNGPELGPGVAEFSAAFSDTSDANTGAVRVDYAPGAWRIFGRVSIGDTESEASAASSSTALSQLLLSSGRTTTATAGANLVVGSAWFVESRLNYTSNHYRSAPSFNAVNGAQPVASAVLFPVGATGAGASFNVTTGNAGSTLSFGAGNGASWQRQLNGIVSATTVRGGHALKIGADIRRLAPEAEIPSIRASYTLGNVATLAGANISRGTVVRSEPAEARLWNLSWFAQDQWQVNEQWVVTYGLRWDVNPAPQVVGDRRPYLVTHPDDPTLTQQRPPTTALWRTDYRGLAPRGAVTYRVGPSGGHDHVLRAAAGMFYDIGWGSATTSLGRGFPFTATRTLTNVSLPLDASDIPELPAPGDSPGPSDVYAFQDEPSLPRSVQWNAGYDFAAGSHLAASATYLGARGRRLTRSISYDYSNVPSAPYRAIYAIDAGGRSAYDALELRLRLRPLPALEGDVSYTLGRSHDNGSDDISIGIPTEQEDAGAVWASSTFDARHAINWRLGGTTPADGWRGLDGVSVYISGQYRSALPLTPVYLRDIGFGRQLLRPDLVPGVPLYLEGDYPGGRRVNPAAFSQPVEPRQGNAPRNLVRGFPLSQVDLSIKKRLQMARVQIDVGLDLFNVFNRPQFDRPWLELGADQFGLATQTAANGLGSGTNGRGLSPLFQLGGPRSIQLVFRTAF